MKALAIVALVFVAAAAEAQSLSITPQQAYVVECGETFVTLSGTNLAGTDSTLVDFSDGVQTYELAPNVATSTSLQAWIPFEVAYSVGSYSVTVKATDAGGGTRTIGPVTFSVIARSSNAPPAPLALPEVINVDATSSSGANVAFDAGGASCDHASGSPFPVGTTTVTCTVVNAYGTTSGSFLVVVNPTFGAPPELSIPEFVVVEATSATGTVVTFSTGGASCNYASGSQFPMGNTTVTCSTSNSYGTSTGSFTIVVTDTTLPSLTLPANITSGNQVVTYSASATDNIDGPISISCIPASGSTFPYGTTVVQCSATDSHANTAIGTFTVTITVPDLSTFTASQNVYQMNVATAETVTYTSNVQVSLNETLTIQSTITGQTVRTLLNSVARTAGTYHDTWDGKNDTGQPLPDGPYQYIAVVTAGGNSFTWNDNTHYMGTSETQLPYPTCKNDAGTFVSCGSNGITFDPYTNKPLQIQYCVPGQGNNTCPNNLPAIVIGKATPSVETDDVCRSTDCFLYEYQSSGTHSINWYGRSIGGSLIGGYGITFIRRTDIWPRNLTLLYGSAPSISSITFSSPVFNPASAPSPLASGEVITVNATSPLSRQISVKAQFRNITSGSILRTVTTPLQTGGIITVGWDGRADNGAWVAPGVYEVIITAADSAGSSTILKPVMTVRYE
jgi:flagellar hook assembly protein FlgD